MVCGAKTTGRGSLFFGGRVAHGRNFVCGVEKLTKMKMVDNSARGPSTSWLAHLDIGDRRTMIRNWRHRSSSGNGKRCPDSDEAGGQADVVPE